MRDLDHLDGAVGAQGSAHAGAGAPLLGDLDLAPLFIVADGVVAAALEATPIDAGAAGLHEVEHAQARAAQGQPLVAVALLARDLARLALDATVDLAYPQRVGDRETVPHEEVHDLELDSVDGGQPLAGHIGGASNAGLKERKGAHDV